LLRAFPLTVMSLATFLVLFTLMMARLTAGSDPALLGTKSAGLVANSSGRSVIRSRTSGAGSATAAAAAGSQAGHAGVPVLTRASGAGAVRYGDD
jgi:uncharacterized protein (DUF697 family)